MNGITKKVCAAILSAAFFISTVFSLTACNKNKKGEAGEDGQTPFIGENGHWWIGEVDTGVVAQGQNGRDGVDGEDGKNGVDGQNGAPGKDGANAVAPLFLYDADSGNLKISYDSGESWSVLVNIGNMVADGVDGVSITSCEINDLGELVVSYSNGKSDNLGVVVATDGVDGAPGKNGVDGVGIVGAEVDVDGSLVITLSNGTVLNLGCVKGQNGSNGTSGIDGVDGIDGTDGVTPKLRINGETDLWEVSYDNGESWESLDYPSKGETGASGVTPIIGIDEDGYWQVSYDLGENWRKLGVKAVGTDGKNGNDGRGVEKVEIIGGYLYVTYTDGSVINAGKVSSETVGGVATTDVWTEALDFYPNEDGTSYSVSIGKAIYMKHIKIPATYNGKPVTAILPSSFDIDDSPNTALESIEIPDSITTIGSEAFALCTSLKTVYIPSSVTEIGICAFNANTTVYFEVAEDVSLGWNGEYLGTYKIEWEK